MSVVFCPGCSTRDKCCEPDNLSTATPQRRSQQAPEAVRASGRGVAVAAGRARARLLTSNQTLGAVSGLLCPEAPAPPFSPAIGELADLGAGIRGLLPISSNGNETEAGPVAERPWRGDS